MVRVLYVIDSLISGGAETSLAHMASAYRDLDLELHVAFLRDRWDVAEVLTTAGATLHPIELDCGRLRQLIALTRLIRRLDPDVVHTTLWEADVIGRTAAAITRRPAITTLANSSYSPAQFANPSIRRAKLRAAQVVDVLTARFARRFHAVSEQVAADMAVRLRIPRSRITVVPRARKREALGESTAERRGSVRRTLGVAEDQPLVLAVARQEFQKGLDVLIDATATLRRAVPDVLVLVAGRAGRASESLRSQIDALGLDGVVRMLGVRTDVPDLIVAADVIAVPSRVEGLPGTVLEAMALERPVVASDIPMVIEAIGPYAHALVPVGDAVALSSALADCLGDGAAGARTSAARRRFDALFTPVAVVGQLRQIYQSVVAASGRAARARAGTDR